MFTLSSNVIDAYQEEHSLLKTFTAVLLQATLSDKPAPFLNQIVEAADVPLHLAKLNQVLLRLLNRDLRSVLDPQSTATRRFDLNYSGIFEYRLVNYAKSFE